jgi:sensor histidine kinase regulating citrate/malate metabolism
MNIKLRAAARTAGLFAIASMTPILIMFLFQLDAETLFYLFLGAFLSWMVWVVYQINLGQLENEEKIKEIQERRSTMISGMIKDPE